MSRYLPFPLAAAILAVAQATTIGQGSPAGASSKGAVIGTGAFTAFVENMDRSLAFYHDAFGMEGVDPAPLRMRIQDRGAARLQVRAQNIDALVARMKNGGMTVVSQGGVAVPIPPNLKGALVADPNNFYLTPFAPAS